MYILALDLALGNTGYCVFEVDSVAKGDAHAKTTIKEVGSINTHKEKERSGKLNLIGNSIINIVEKYGIQEVAIEKPFSRFVKATQAIFSVTGVAQYVLHGRNMYFYPPSSVKKSVVGTGKASKEEVAYGVGKMFPKTTFNNLDESDSVGVGICHLREIGVIE